MTTALNRKLQQLLKTMEPRVAREFEAAIAGIVNNVKLAALVSAIERGNIEDAIRILDLDRAAFSAMNAAIGSAYTQAGATVVANTVWRDAQASKVVIYWNATNPRAERWLSETSSQMVTRLTREAAEVVRNTISTGYAQGMGPRQIALDIVGRVNTTGRRSGGVVGLSWPQADAVTRSKADLARKTITLNVSGRLETYEGSLSKYLTRTKRDKRFDGTIRKAIREGRSLTDAEISKITGRYANRLLKLRGDTIARTETAQAVESARQEAVAQWQDKTGISDQFITRRWDHTGNTKNARDWHWAMNGTTVQGMVEPFVTPRGARMMYPLDSSLGASASETVNCRCMQTVLIDYKAMAV